MSERGREMKKQPEITEQTRQNLMEAFWRIYSVEDLSACTVRRVTETAGYCRSTFYEYFRDIPDLLEQLEDEIVAECTSDVSALFLNTTLEQITASAEGIHRSHGDQFYVLLVKNNNMTFYNKLKDAVCDAVLESMETEEGEEYAVYAVDYASSGYINCFMRWYREGKKLPLEEIGAFIFELLRHGVLPAAVPYVKSKPMEKLISAGE